MNLSNANFFGKQTYESDIVEYPPYSQRLTLTRYGYESGSTIYDVVIPPRPIGEQRITRWYKTNGVTSLLPSSIHKAIEAHFNL